MARRAQQPRFERMNEGFFEVEAGWEIAYQWIPAEGASSAPPIVFLNGLGDSYEAWSPLMPRFKYRNCLLVDLRGQGRALEHRLRQQPETVFRVPVHTQSEDLRKLLQNLGVAGAVDIVGFSYGGAVAFDFASRWPNETRRLALIVPYTLRLDRSFPLQRLWSWQWKTARNFGLIPTSLGDGIENAYESFLTAYMNQRYDHRMGETSRKKASIDLTHGIMSFNAFDVVEHLPDHSVFLLTSELDTLIPRSLFKDFWRHLPESKRGDWTRIEDGDHLLLEQKPDLVCEWISRVLDESGQK